MLTKVSTKNYQSVADQTLELAPFTVIVGPSNSGKSATLRSLRTLVYNSASPSFVRAGTKSSEVQATFSDGNKVTIERGPSLSTYHTFYADAAEQVYVKAGTSVPSDVAKILAMPQIEGESLNFAFQFDRPFLLDSPGSRVAKILGDLTNVTIIYDAAREANRRRLDVSSRLRIRHEDERNLTDALGQFRDLKAEKTALEAAETLLTRLQATAGYAKTLKDRLEAAETLSARLKEAQAVSLPDLDTTALDSLVAKVIDLRERLRQSHLLMAQLVDAKNNLMRRRQEAISADMTFTSALAALGFCPTCGQKIES